MGGSLWPPIQAFKLSHPHSIAHELVNSLQLFKQRLKPVERQTVGSIRKRSLRVVMHLHENAVHSASYTCASQILDELGVSSACRAEPSRTLKAVSHIMHDRITKASHDRHSAEVDNQVVVAETRSPFG